MAMTEDGKSWRAWKWLAEAHGTYSCMVVAKAAADAFMETMDGTGAGAGDGMPGNPNAYPDGVLDSVAEMMDLARRLEDAAAAWREVKEVLYATAERVSPRAAAICIAMAHCGEGWAADAAKACGVTRRRIYGCMDAALAEFYDALPPAEKAAII